MTSERLPLSRRRIADAAIDIGDSEGIDAITMRRVGSALGVEAMSLYNHVANKDDLLDSIGEVLYGEVIDGFKVDPDRCWRENARDLVQSYYDVAMGHPNLFPIISDRPFPAPTKVEFLRSVYEIFLGAGFNPEDAALMFSIASNWLTGTVRAELGLMRRLHEEGVGISKDDLPVEVHSTIDFMEACISWTPEDRLERGFDLLISGIERELPEG